MERPLMSQILYQARGFQALAITLQGGQIRTLAWEKPSPVKLPTGVAGLVPDERRLAKRLLHDLDAYFAGLKSRFDWPLDLKQGTAFQQKVWRALGTIPYGETRSYQWLAKKIGHPQAVRAVGSANKANPFPLVLPCHRVVRTDGQLGGYASGIALKQALLALESKYGI